MLKKIIYLCFKGLIAVAYKSFSIEGVNALLLVMPAKLIIPTLRKYGASIGEETILHSPLIIHNAGNDYHNLIIGNHCYFGRGVFLDLKEKIMIRDRVTVSMRVTLITHTDAGESEIKKIMPPSQAAIKIEAGAYLGANVIVLQGVQIQEGSAVGAGSLVLHDIPAGTLYAGNPAKMIKSINA